MLNPSFIFYKRAKDHVLVWLSAPADKNLMRVKSEYSTMPSLKTFYDESVVTTEIRPSGIRPESRSLQSCRAINFRSDGDLVGMGFATRGKLVKQNKSRPATGSLREVHSKDRNSAYPRDHG